MLRIIMRWLFSTELIALLCTISIADSQDTKTWHPNTNFLNPENWENGQLPCENDRILFPDSAKVITMMPESLTVSELVLPVDGEIIFPERGTLDLTGGTREGACTGKDMHFKTSVYYWYDPINWNITSDRAFPRIPNRRNAAVPHAFQVPCPTDKVEFLENTTFQTHVLYPLTKVASMHINGMSYSQSDFEDLLSSHVGSLLFPNNPRFRITSSPCTDESGCACGNDAEQIQPTICNQVTPDCPDLDCSDPITPTGNCCPVCGAQILIQNKQNFKMSTLMTLHDSFLSKEEYRGVESFTAKTHKGDIQSVFIDGEQYKGLANKVAQKIHDVLQSDINGARLYEIRSLSISKSKAWKTGVITYDQYISRGMSSGGVAALVIMFIVLISLAVLFYIYKKRHISGFNFARFDLRGDKIELELGTTPHDELQPVDPPAAASSSSKEQMSKGFDNPVYGTAIEEVSSPVEESQVTKDFVENPMFMIFEETSKQDSKENE